MLTEADILRRDVEGAGDRVILITERVGVLVLIYEDRADPGIFRVEYDLTLSGRVQRKRERLPKPG